MMTWELFVRPPRGNPPHAATSPEISIGLGAVSLIGGCADLLPPGTETVSILFDRASRLFLIQPGGDLALRRAPKSSTLYAGRGILPWLDWPVDRRLRFKAASYGNAVGGTIPLWGNYKETPDV